MKYTSALAFVAMISGGAAVACPWSGGSYEGRDISLEIEFSVNEACSEITLKSSGNTGFQPIDVAQTFPMEPSRKEWKADINGAEMMLSEDGKGVLFIANGNDVRVNVTPVD